MERRLVCNLMDCRQPLSSGYAWLTKCSHIFCDKDGQKYLVEQSRCPTCSQRIEEADFEVIRVDLNPSEGYKTMVLAGQKPEVIMDICSRAINFWIYQTTQESLYKDVLKEMTMKREFNQLVTSSSVENKSLSSKLELAQSELESLRETHKNLVVTLGERTNELQAAQRSLAAWNNRNNFSSSGGHSSPKRAKSSQKLFGSACADHHVNFPFGSSCCDLSPSMRSKSSPLFTDNQNESPEKEDYSAIRKLLANKN